MDLGLSGRKALVCASSRGLGFACAEALLREGCEVTINGRSEARLEQAATLLEERHGRRPRIVEADLNTAEGRTRLIGSCSGPDILVNNNAGPPPGKLDDWDHDAWLLAIEANMLAPILLIREVVPGMRQRKFGRIINITSAMVKSPAYEMSLSTTARTGLTAFSKALSRKVAQDNVTINNLLPERMDTGRLHGLMERARVRNGWSEEEARAAAAAPIAAKRFGRPEELGDACAFLCSAQAGYISGQNLQVDGGSYVGLI